MPCIASAQQRELIGDAKVDVHDGPIDAWQLVTALAARSDAEGRDEPFLLLSLDALLDRVRLWRDCLPHVQAYYGVKCNPDQVLLRVLATFGVNFSCASKQEIDQVLNLGVAADRLLFANPCKTRAFIKHAEDCGVHRMTFDTEEELEKIASLHGSAQLVLRIGIPDPEVRELKKFGAEPEIQAPKLLARAQQLGLNVQGISFHAAAAADFDAGIRSARRLFDVAEALGHRVEVVDLAGGFPTARSPDSFEATAKAISTSLELHFAGRTVKVIAEAGAFFAAAPFTLCAAVIHATECDFARVSGDASSSSSSSSSSAPCPDQTTGMMYYLNDGVYGSFSAALFSHLEFEGKPLHPNPNAPVRVSTVWGPTCDSIDCIETRRPLPVMQTGDWIVYPEMGAYSSAASTTFNGFQRPRAFYAISRPNWELIADLL